MAGVRVAVRVRPFNGREKQMDARLVVDMRTDTQVPLGGEEEASPVCRCACSPPATRLHPRVTWLPGRETSSSLTVSPSTM